MSAADFFDAARAYKRELTGQPLSQDDVDYFNVLLGKWGAQPAAAPAPVVAVPPPPTPAPTPATAQPTDPVAPMAWGAKVSATFRARVQWIAAQLSIEASDLMACMAWESGRTFSSSVRNEAGSGAVGLVQFMPSTAQSLGTSTAELAAMTPEDQLNFVFKLFEPYKGRLHDLSDVYMAILYPRAVGQPDSYVLFSGGIAYQENAGLDANHDGVVTKLEAAAKVYAIRTEGLQPGNFA